MGKIAAFGEVMQRLTPPLHQRIIQAACFDVLYTGTGLNVLGALSQFGNKTKLITTLPANALGQAATKTVQSFGVDTSGIKYDGQYLGMYFLEQGEGIRPSHVIYNREYSSFVRARKELYDWNRLFKDVKIIHFCGISLAVSENTRETVIEAIQAAKDNGVLVSLDFNFRPSLWTKEVAKKVYEDILPYIDICFAGHRDFSEILNILPIDQHQTYEEMIGEMIQILAKKYPNMKYIAATNRNILPSQEHQFDAFFSNMKEVETYQSSPFVVKERIGGGDAFVAGILDGIINEETSLQKTLCFAAQSSIYKHTIVGDTMLASREEIMQTIQRPNIDVVR